MLSREEHFTVLNMIQHGGSFVRSLATTYQLADGQNRDKIRLLAFPDIWEKYSEGWQEEVEGVQNDTATTQRDQ
jgi:hypothetical protein